MAYKSYPNTDEIELQRLNSNSDAGSTKGVVGKKLERTVNFSSDIDINGNKMPKVNKNVQFSTQQVFENEYEFEIKPNLIPNRKRWENFNERDLITRRMFITLREEETVMDNLRKRVGELQLDKTWKRQPKEKEREPREENEEEKPLLLKVWSYFGFQFIFKKVFLRTYCVLWEREKRSLNDRLENNIVN